MSLDVYLTVSKPVPVAAGSGIFVRRNGQTVEISREEWDSLHPVLEPVTFVSEETETDTVFHANITHNLGMMASAAGIYQYVWRPEEIGITQARQLIEPLEKGLSLLKREPDTFKKLNPENGWGTYDGFLPWIQRYIDACIEYPDAAVSVCR